MDTQTRPNKTNSDSFLFDKNYDHSKFEKNIYNLWQTSGCFKPSDSKEKYTILMPPPNANASLHSGHAMYTVDDILIRFKRMQGYSALWIPGLDHAGLETQFVYEKHLAKQDKSRMDFDRKTLYENIAKFVQDNSGLIFEQFKRLGFSADWDRAVFTLDPKVTSRVFDTFKKMDDEGLVYKNSYIVNYCPSCGTTLAELEVLHLERTDPLYYLKYKIDTGNEGFIEVATVRPETIFGDTAIAVNPKDPKYKRFVGKTAKIPLINRSIPIIEDLSVDSEFGTGAVKVTPAHDPNDFEMGRRHKLEEINVIDLYGRMRMPSGFEYPEIEGKKAKSARDLVAAKLESAGFIEKIDHNYIHSVTVCYKCKHDLEPLTMPNWFVKVADLKNKVKESVEKEEINFYPKRFKRHMLSWLDVMHDWPISRQNVWGIRIPVWYEVDPKSDNIWVWWIDDNKETKSGQLNKFLSAGIALEKIEKGLQKVQAKTGENAPNYLVSAEKPKKGLYLPETDTFDTWFSSGQWPLVTLKDDELETRFPTDLLGTLSDILKFWVSRMIMFSLYLENKIPFKNVYLWAMVADSKGVKMSKSKGNAINPLDLVDKYGADALRMSLMFGTPAGSKVILAEEKVKGMRNFANKLWNIARLVLSHETEQSKSIFNPATQSDRKIISELNNTIETVTVCLEKYKLNEASEAIYEFIWHKFADIYIEESKTRLFGSPQESKLIASNLHYVLNIILRLLHPFMPFVTEAIWSMARKKNSNTFDSPLLINASWPVKID